jgi:hypothetical protein
MIPPSDAMSSELLTVQLLRSRDWTLEHEPTVIYLYTLDVRLASVYTRREAGICIH